MIFDWLQPAELRPKIIGILQAMKEGHKQFWLVDEIVPKYHNRFKNEISKHGFCMGFYFNECFVWLPEAEVCDFTELPYIFDVELHTICTVTDGMLDIVNDALRCIRYNKIFNNMTHDHLTPTIIGILLGYPFVYKIGENFTESKNTLNNCDLAFYKVEYNGICISSFTVPFSLKHLCASWATSQMEHKSLRVTSTTVNLPSVCL